MLLLVAIPLFLSVGFIIRQKIIVQEIKVQLEKESLQHITISLADLNWTDEGKEIIIGGKLFDVRSFSLSKNNITVLGLFDNKEDRLHEQLLNLVHEKKGIASPVNEITVKFIFFPVYDNACSFTLDNFCLISAHRFPIYDEMSRKISLSCSTPPPRYT